MMDKLVKMLNHPGLMTGLPLAGVGAGAMAAGFSDTEETKLMRQAMPSAGQEYLQQSLQRHAHKQMMRRYATDPVFRMQVDQQMQQQAADAAAQQQALMVPGEHQF